MIARYFALSFLVNAFRSGWAVTLDEDFVSRSQRAAELSDAIYKTNPGISGASVFTDEPDKALFLKEGDVCWAVFRGTVQTIDDWLENFDFSPKHACSTSNRCCSTHGGFRDAYFLPSYKSQLESAVRNCKSNCPDCDVVLTGHSQGAAIASIAAIAMEDLDPTIINFGQPASIIGSCSIIDVRKYFRYVNTIVDGSGELYYDPCPFANIAADQRGSMFLLGDDDENVAFYKNGEGLSITGAELDVDAHSSDYYILRLFDLLEKGIFPIGLDGWDIGFPCNEDSECVTPGNCVQHRCSLGMDGDSCHGNGDCDSDRCEGTGTWLVAGECETRLDNGSGCNEDSDCLSNQCNWLWKCS